MSEIICPYCSKGFKLKEEDIPDFECDTGQTSCPHCSKNFIFTTTGSVVFDVDQADCLNGAPHEWFITKSTPKCFTEMRCLICREEREPTPEEAIKYEIPSKKEYLDKRNFL